MGHGVVYLAVVLFLAVVAGWWPATIVALSWGIGLAAHGFFGVVAPGLRERWVADEVGLQVRTSVLRERRSLGNEHAREMHRLSAAVAHEIRNPITAAKSLVQQMGEDPAAAENVEYARVAIEELDRVERSIAHLLRYAREQDIALADVRLGDVVRAALGSAQLDGVSVTTDLCDDDAMRGDADALRRVVLNLLDNARDAIEEAAPRAPAIAIVSGRDLSGGELWLEVRDNGTGIDSETAESMFAPLFTRKAKGTGLGLAICRKICEAHGGRIEVVDVDTVGAALRLSFPAAEDAC
jgi:two-component system sensor histidine kinase HydH